MQILAAHSSHERDDKGETTGILITTYDGDGTKTVREYDTNFDEAGEAVYDAGGNVVSGS